MKDIMITDKKIMFIHVPKTGGTSISSRLRSQFEWVEWWSSASLKYPPGIAVPPSGRSRHEPLFMLEAKNNTTEFFSFAVVRNPYTRTYSLYRHFTNIVRHLPADLQSIASAGFETFLEFIKPQLDIVNHIHFNRPHILFHDYITYSQTFFVTDLNTQISVDKVYRFENLDELAIDFDIELPKINTGNYTHEEYLNDYTPKAIDLVKEIYAKDFTNFGYSFDFS